jgi:hypothetical protein
MEQAIADFATSEVRMGVCAEYHWGGKQAEIK